MYRKKTFIVSIIAIIIILISLFGITYGYYNNVSGNELAKKAVFNSQIIEVTYSDGTEEIVSKEGNVFTPGSTLTKTFTIKNTGTVAVKYSINLTDIVNDFERKEDLIYELTSDSEINNESLSKPGGIFPTTDISILSKDVLNIGESRTYTLTIKYLTSKENQIVDQGKKLNAKITIDETVKTIKSLKIYGNSIQPSGKNLFDVANSNVIGGYISGTKLVNYGNTTTKTIVIPCESNAIYTVSRQIIGNRFTIASSTNAPANNIEMTKVISGYTNSSLTITTGPEDKYLYVWFYNGNLDKDYSDQELMQQIQIEEGSVATEYEEFVASSPDSPITIKSLGISKNLLDINEWYDYYNQINNSYIAKKNDPQMGEYISMRTPYYVTKSKFMQGRFKENTQYTFSYYFKLETPLEDEQQYHTGIRIMYTDGTNSYSITDYAHRTTDWVKVTFTTNANKTIDYIYFLNRQNYSHWVGFSKMQIEEGKTASDYEPYGKYTIPIYATGRNLLKVEGVHSWGVYIDGQYKNGTNPSDTIQHLCENSSLKYNASASSGNINYMTKLKPNTTYIYGIEHIEDDETDHSAKVGLYALKPNENLSYHYAILPHNEKFIKTSTNGKDGYYMFTTNSTDLLYGFSTACTGAATGSKVVKYKLYLYEVTDSNINFTYEKFFGEYFYIFIDNPLKKVGDCDTCSDYIDFNNNEVVRNTKEVNLNGTEDWAYNGTTLGTYSYLIYLNESNFGYRSYTNLLSDRFKLLKKTSLSNENEESGIYTGDSINFVLNHNLFTSLENYVEPTTTNEAIELWKSYLNQNPTQIVYLTNNENRETITLPELITPRPIEDIKVCSNNGVCASKIEIEYDE